MQQLEIETAQNVSIAYPTASLVERIIAYLIDLAILVAYSMITYAFWDGLRGVIDYENYDSLIFVLTIPVFLFYRLAFEYWNNGQTIGKKLRKIRVMQLDGSRPTLGSYFTRWIVGLLEFYVFLGSIATLSIMLTEKSQRLGDLAANTCVVKNEPLVLRKHITDRNFEPNYEIQFPKVALFNDRQAELINTVLTNPYNELRNREIIVLAEKIKTTYHITDNLDRPPREFLEQLLSDYAYNYWLEENKGQYIDLSKSLTELLLEEYN